LQDADIVTTTTVYDLSNSAILEALSDIQGSFIYIKPFQMWFLVKLCSSWPLLLHTGWQFLQTIIII